MAASILSTTRVLICRACGADYSSRSAASALHSHPGPWRNAWRLYLSDGTVAYAASLRPAARRHASPRAMIA